MNELIKTYREKKLTISEDKIIEYSKQVVKGLKFLYSEDLYQNIKLSNVLFDEKMTLKLADFEVSIISHQLNNHDINCAKDKSENESIRSLGYLLYEMCTLKVFL